MKKKNPVSTASQVVRSYRQPKPLTSISGTLPNSTIQKTGSTNSILYGLFLLTLLTPLIYNNTSFFGFITGRTLYFRTLVLVLGVAALYSKKIPFSLSKLTRLQGSILVFIVILALADAMGIDPTNSFLSGYSRMEGFLAYFHYTLYFLVLSQAGFSKHRWNLALFVSVAVAAIAVLYGASQSSGWQFNHYRLIATIGNPSYLGLYLLLNLFLLIYLFNQFPTVSRLLKATLLLILGGILLWGIVASGTRSALIGLGAGLAILFIGSIGIRFGWSRQSLLIGTATILISVGLLTALQRSRLSTNIPYLDRLASFSFSDNTAQPRYLNWKMAFEGLVDRPILGWGQENYSYGFSHYYDPALLLSGTETYDRAHNLLLDIGFSAGLPGLLAYVLIWYYLLQRLRKNPLFSPLDRLALLGFLVAYLAFVLLNFDSLVSAQVFFFLLAFVDTDTVVKPNASLQASAGTRLVFPLAVGAMVLCLGFYTLSAWQTLRLLNQYTQMPTYQAQAKTIETAYQQAQIGQIDISDVLASLATSILPNSNVSATDKAFCYERALATLKNERQKHPKDGRLPIRQAGLYVTYADLTQASALYDTILHTDSQRQPRLWFQAGVVSLKNQQPDKARRQFQEAYRRQHNWQIPLIYEALSHTAQNDTSRARSVMKHITTPILVENFELVKSVYLMNQDTTGLLARLDFVPYVDRSPYFTVPLYQEWALLAFDVDRIDQVSSALLSFYFAHKDRVSKSAVDKLITQARNGIRPEGIDKLLSDKVR